MIKPQAESGMEMVGLPPQNSLKRSRRFLEIVPLLSGGFETETEITLQALEEERSVETQKEKAN